MVKGKVILITGSTTGIGAAIARRCVVEGARVMIHGRDKVRAAQLCKELGDLAEYCLVDLEEDPVAAAHQLIEATISAFGALHAVVNNAAIYPRNRIDDFDEIFFNRLFNMNVKVPLFLAQQAVAVFREQETGGNILNIGSINAHCGETSLLIYSMTKGALMTMTRNLGDALGKELIRVNQLNVGWTVTENEDAMKKSEGFPEGWQKMVPVTYAPSGKLLEPENVARHAVFWLSDKSAPASGVVYELEQYPVIGRNLITEIELGTLQPRTKGVK